MDRLLDVMTERAHSKYLEQIAEIVKIEEEKLVKKENENIEQIKPGSSSNKA